MWAEGGVRRHPLGWGPESAGIRRELADAYAAEREEFDQVAAALGVEGAEIRVIACPLVVSGTLDGRFFYLRERWGEYRVCVADDEDPLRDVWADPGAPEVEVASGVESDFDGDGGLGVAAAALTVAVAAVKDYVAERP